MKRKDTKGPETPKTRHRIGDDPVPPIEAYGFRHQQGGVMLDRFAGTNVSYWHTERPISPDVYPVIDTDIGRDNVENDLPAADRQDL